MRAAGFRSACALDQSGMAAGYARLVHRSFAAILPRRADVALAPHRDALRDDARLGYAPAAGRDAVPRPAAAAALAAWGVRYWMVHGFLGMVAQPPGAPGGDARPL